MPNKVGADDGDEFHQASGNIDLVAVPSPLFQPRALKTSVRTWICCQLGSVSCPPRKTPPSWACWYTQLALSTKAFLSTTLALSR